MFTRLILVVLVTATAQAVLAGPTYRIFVVREKAIFDQFKNEFMFRLTSINGYSIKVRTPQTEYILKIGQSFSPEKSDCKVIFEEIATETRIARFKTNCP